LSEKRAAYGVEFLVFDEEERAKAKELAGIILE